MWPAIAARHTHHRPSALTQRCAELLGPKAIPIRYTVPGHMPLCQIDVMTLCRNSTLVCPRGSRLACQIDGDPTPARTQPILPRPGHQIARRTHLTICRTQKKPPRDHRGGCPEPAIGAPGGCREERYGKTISTRRFCGSRTPSGVGTRGSFIPRPATIISLRGTPRPSRATATALARRSERRWLYPAEPERSVYPVT